MKIQIVSDLHLEFDKKSVYEDQLIPSAPVLVVAGDLCGLETDIEDEFVQWASTRWDKIIRVPGNHEYYNCSAVDKSLKTENSKNFVTVDNGIVEYGGVTFVCSTLWSHIPPAYEMHVKNALNDFRYVRTLPKYNRLSVPAYNLQHKISSQFLRDAVISSKMPTVVVTHHLPTWRVVSKYWKGDPLTYGFATEMFDFMDDNSDRIQAWIHGHSHESLNIDISGIRVVRNPYGYPSEHTKYGYKTNFTIEVINK